MKTGVMCKRLFLFSLLSFITLSVVFLSGYFVHAWLYPSFPNFPLLSQAFSILSDYALNDLPPTPVLEYGMVHGMIQAYGDPYTIFVEPVQHELETNNLQGSFGGIGVQLSKDNAGHILLIPFPDSPALHAGILENDRLLAVDNLTIQLDTPIDDIQAQIRGPEGQSVLITIGRSPDFQPIQILIERESIPLPSVNWYIAVDERRLGVIKVNLIAASTPDEVLKATQDLQSRGATHFVLDLRDNGGGLVKTGVDTARLFLRDGIVIQEQYRGQSVETYRVEQAGQLMDIPLIILINHGTASAAEIIAGALQTQGRAKLIGFPSYGKDTIQFVFDLADGSSLHVTSGHWWIPGHDQTISGNGLQPDYLIQSDAIGSDPGLAAAIQVLFHP